MHIFQSSNREVLGSVGDRFCYLILFAIMVLTRNAHFTLIAIVNSQTTTGPGSTATS